MTFFIYFTLHFHRKSGDSSGSRQIRNTPDWSDNAVAGDHLWVPTSVSGDCCYVGDNDCTVSSSTFNPSMCVCYFPAEVRRDANLHESIIKETLPTLTKVPIGWTSEISLSAIEKVYQTCLRDLKRETAWDGKLDLGKLVHKSEISIKLFWDAATGDFSTLPRRHS